MRETVFYIFFWMAGSVHAQIVNGYANVTAISGITLTVASVDETAHTFEDGAQVVLMQMQDNCIGSNTTNVSTFGDLSSIQSAGLYEIFQISSHTEVAGLPTNIVLDHLPNNTYNLNANASVQLITYRTYGAPDYTTTSNMTAKAWNGTTGGVLAIEVTGTLTLAHNLSANGIGFRGGAASANYYSGGSGCSTTEFIRTSNHTRAGSKGEGIYKTATTNFLYASGHLLNGGGGGSERINCGGGGGGNYTVGGLGGVGWSCGGPGGGGLGGISLSSQISAIRIFMGGGGGGGQQNDSQGSAGGNGGGIILVKAGSIITQGTCGGRVISANGNTVTGLTNDGQGGGGAGGTVVIKANSFSILGTCALTISASGGGGGTVHTSDHAGGGGGAQGLVIYSIAQPTANVVTQVFNGPSGCNNNSVPCSNAAGVPTGTNNSGIVTSAFTPLPIELLEFTVKLKEQGKAHLFWQTASEKNCQSFELQRSEGAIEWTLINVQGCKSSSSERRTYEFVDKTIIPNRDYYYRLRQVDEDQSSNYSPIVYLSEEKNVFGDLIVAPNPNTGHFAMSITDQAVATEVFITLQNNLGQMVFNNKYAYDAEINQIEVDLNNKIRAGIYTLKVQIGVKIYSKKLVITNE